MGRPATASDADRSLWGRVARVKHWDFWDWTTVFIYIIFILLVLYPLFALFRASLFDAQGQFSVASYGDFVRLKYYRQAFFNSFKVSGLAMFFAILLGVPIAYAMTRYNIKGKSIISTMIIMSLLSPPFIGAYSWILALGNNGFITRFLNSIGIPFKSIYGWHGIVFAFALHYYPHIYLYVSGALKTIDTSLEEASESLGMTPWNRFRTVTMPLIFPTISTGALMVFMASFADFGTPMLLGQGFKTLPVLAFEQFISEMGGNPAMASTLSMILLVCTTSVLFLQRYLVSRRRYAMTGLRTPKVQTLKPLTNWILSGLIGFVALVSIIPQLTIVVTSFRNKSGPVFHPGFSLDSYREVLFRVPRAITNTYTYSTIALILMLIIGMLTAYLLVRRRSKYTAFLDGLAMIPYVIPGTVLGISLILAFNRPPLVLTGTWMILVASFMVRKIPYTIRSSTAILYQLDKAVEEASISLGVPPLPTFFKTTARLMLPGVLSGGILSFITTINELSSSIVLYTGATATISVTVYTEVFNSNYGTGAALASILTFSTLICLIIARVLMGNRDFQL